MRLLKASAAALLFMILTALTQVGGLAYLLGLAVGRIPRLRRSTAVHRRAAIAAATVAIYAVMTILLVPPLAQSMGRVQLPCATGSDEPVVAATSLTCALNRGYVRKEVRDLVATLASELQQRFPRSQVTTLEGNFPFIDGFPLLPHLSHRDGRKIDIAYFYRDADGTPVSHGSPSFLGYFIYEQPRAGEPVPCAGRWTPLRWDFDWLQPAAPHWQIDQERTAWMLQWLKDQPRVSRIFIEPHLAQRLGVAGGKVRFQGCRAARHDDHIHVDMD